MGDFVGPCGRGHADREKANHKAGHKSGQGEAKARGVQCLDVGCMKSSGKAKVGHAGRAFEKGGRVAEGLQ